MNLRHLLHPYCHRRLRTLTLGLVAAQLACAAGFGELAHSGVEGGLGGGLEALHEPRNRAMLHNLLQDPVILEAARDLTAAITRGAIDGVSDEDRSLQIREASDAYIQTISEAVGTALDEEISPAVTRGVGDVVGGAVSEAIRPENARLARNFVDGVGRSAVAAFMQSTSQGLRDDLGPALNHVLQEELGPGLQQVIEANLGPALQRMVEDNVGPALRTVIERDLQPLLDSAFEGEDGGASGLFARALSRQIVLGVNDGMSELGVSLAPNHEDGLGLLQTIPIVLGLLILLLSAVLLRMYQSRRELAEDRARSEEMLVSILRAVKLEHEPGAAPDFNTVIARAREQIPNREGYEAYLANIITRAQLPPPPLTSTTRKPSDGAAPKPRDPKPPPLG